MSSEYETIHKPRLHIVKKDEYYSKQIGNHLNALTDALATLKNESVELRQLWQETQWLKDEFARDLICIPTNWELMILQIARGNVSQSMRRHPEILRAAAALGKSIQELVRRRLDG